MTDKEGGKYIGNFEEGYFNGEGELQDSYGSYYKGIFTYLKRIIWFLIKGTFRNS